MKTRAEKSSTVTSPAVVQRARSAFMASSSAGTFFSPSRAHVAAGVQCKMTVNQPGDKFEQEADKMADKVMRMPTPACVVLLEASSDISGDAGVVAGWIGMAVKDVDEPLRHHAGRTARRSARRIVRKRRRSFRCGTRTCH